MEQSRFIAALDMGTSKMVAMVARKNESGVLSILHAERVESETCMRRGCVFNADVASSKVSRLIRRLNAGENLNSTIEKIYVGIGGQSMRTESYSVKKGVEGGIVTQGQIDAIYKEIEEYTPEFAEILEIVSPEFYLDGQPEPNPVGASSSVIEVRVQLVLGRPLLKKTLTNAIQERARTKIAGFFISPLATAEAVLSEKEKELGCALIEFGAGITYLSIYKGGSLKYLIAIPLGGAVITKDICSLDVLEKEAEDLKINYGSALLELHNEDKIKSNNDNILSRDIEVKNLNTVIEARINEILENIIEQINESGFSASLAAGIIITGGASSLQDLPELIKNRTAKEVRKAVAKKTLVNQAADLSQQPANSCIIGLLSLGKENCLKEKEEADKDIFGQPITVKEPPRQHKPSRPAPQPQDTEKKQSKGSGGLFGIFTRKIEGISEKMGGISDTLFNEEAFKDSENEEENKKNE